MGLRGWSQRIIAMVRPALVASEARAGSEDHNMIDLRALVTKRSEDQHPQERVRDRRHGFPQAGPRPAALHRDRCVQVALDPGTGEYRLAII